MASTSAPRGARDLVMCLSTTRGARRVAASCGCCSSVSGSSMKSMSSPSLERRDAGAAFGLCHSARPRRAEARAKLGATGCSFTKNLPWGAAAPLQGANDSTGFWGWPRRLIPLLSPVHGHKAERARSTLSVRCPAAGRCQRPVSCGVTLYGIDSIKAPLPVRADAWQHLARDLDPGRLEAMTNQLGRAPRRRHGGNRCPCRADQSGLSRIAAIGRRLTSIPRRAVLRRRLPGGK